LGDIQTQTPFDELSWVDRMFIAGRFINIPSGQIVRFAQFLGQHILVLTAILLVFLVILAALFWRAIERHADDFWDRINRLLQSLGSRAPIRSAIKRYPKIASFLFQRFVPGEYLGLHLTIGLIVISASAFVFLQIADEVGEQEWLTTFDQAFSIAMHEYSSKAGIWVFEQVTQLGAATTLGIIGVIATISLLLLRQWIFLAGWIIALLGIGILDSGLKGIFQRVRPNLDNPWITETGWSFPSGHALGTVIIYGFLAYMLVLIARRTSQRVVIVAAWIMLSAAVGLSRLYLGVHYFSDVVAGFVVALSWLAICVTGCEVARRGRNNPPATTSRERREYGVSKRHSC
jgi:undecaprenyl-diphosphatase